MADISFAQASPDDREAALGREFRNIYVESANFDGFGCVVAHIDGRRVALIGDPQKALATYLAGGLPCGEAQGEH